MSLFCSTFIAGMGELIAEVLPRALRGVSIKQVGDGVVLYESSAPAEVIRSLRFFNNSFLVLSLAKELPKDDPLKGLIAFVRQDPALPDLLERIAQQGKTYGLWASVSNKMTALTQFQREKMERFLFTSASLRPDQKTPKQMLWLLTRAEGFGILGLRLTRQEEKLDHELQKGELRPELAHLLCLLSEPKPTDVFLDACAGSGAIPLERARAFPFKKILAGDNDARLVAALERQVPRKQKEIEVSEMDAQTLEGIPDRSVDAVVTDPPWGMYDAGMFDLEQFLSSLSRVCKPGARIVLLLGRTVSLPEHSKMKKRKTMDILVSGQKATVYVMEVL